MIILEALRTDLEAEERNATLAILSSTEEDVFTDDFEEGREINYHLVKPTQDWLAARIWWAPSIQGNTETWTAWISDQLVGMEEMQDMLVCLNKVIITTDSDEDENAIVALMDDCEDICDYLRPNLLGIEWRDKSSVVINLEHIRNTVDENCAGWGPYYAAFYAEEIRECFLTTLYHELRHLGLECNPFLPKDAYPDSARSEFEVERWAKGVYEKYHTS